MSNNDLIPKTRREVMMCRKAFEVGINMTWSHFRLSHSMEGGSSWPGTEALAAKAYPLPIVPRVVRVPEQEYRIVGGEVQFRFANSNDTWEKSLVTIDDIRELNKLIDDPTKIDE